jgi:phosphatidylserine/phosphatidylglycerophosphate/cardiolipin synthase-like enzyme/uncharacterized membrane protein YdjX (TVP38/TMEM64 family)
MADDKPNAALMFSRLMGDFQNSFQNFDRLHQMHRKNLEAMMEMNQLSVEAMQSFARRQADIMQRTTSLFARASTEMLSARSPSDVAGRQLEIARDAFVMAQTELKALAQMTVAANQDLQRIYAERVSDTLGNIVPGRATPTSPAAAAAAAAAAAEDELAAARARPKAPATVRNRPVGDSVDGTMSEILSPGDNCWASCRSDRTAFLVDGQNYFRALAATLRRAERSILIVGWDFHSRIQLEPDAVRKGEPARLGKLLNWLARHRRKLRIDILIWDAPAVFAFDRERPPLFGKHWRTHPRVRFRFDADHPLGGCHHEKIVVVDDEVAFVGGIDLTHWRWDTCGHELNHSCRVDPVGASYDAVHDVQMMVSGEAARTLGGLVRSRWAQTGARPPRPVSERFDIWPSEIVPDVTDTEIAIARTRPAFGGAPEVREVERLYLAAIAAAKRSIYIESQYFTAERITAALAARLDKPDAPDIVILLPDQCKGWLEEVTMGAARLEHLRALARADRHGKLAVFRPVRRCADGSERPFAVHSKLMIVDDRLVRIGSSNLANRSMGLDSETDLAIEAIAPRTEAAIAALQNRLIAEHVGCAEAEVMQARLEHGSLLQAIRALDGRSSRMLTPIDLWPPVGIAETLTPKSLYDPDRPTSVEAFMHRLIYEPMPNPGRRRRYRITRWTALVAFAVAVVLLLVATPLGRLVSPENVAHLLGAARASEFAPVYGLAVFTGLAAILVPVTVLVAATGVVFPGLTGGLISMAGVLLVASGAFWVGRVLGERAIRRLAGQRLNALSRRLSRRGIWAISALRLVPVAPFALVNLMAGISHVRFRDFIAGTAIGTLPGVVAATMLGSTIAHFAVSSDAVDWLAYGGIAAAAAALLTAAWRWRRRIRQNRAVTMTTRTQGAPLT